MSEQPSSPPPLTPFDAFKALTRKLVRVLTRCFRVESGYGKHTRLPSNVA